MQGQLIFQGCKVRMYGVFSLLKLTMTLRNRKLGIKLVFHRQKIILMQELLFLNAFQSMKISFFVLKRYQMMLLDR